MSEEAARLRDLSSAVELLRQELIDYGYWPGKPGIGLPGWSDTGGLKANLYFKIDDPLHILDGFHRVTHNGGRRLPASIAGSTDAVVAVGLTKNTLLWLLAGWKAGATWVTRDWVIPPGCDLTPHPHDLLGEPAVLSPEIADGIDAAIRRLRSACESLPVSPPKLNPTDKPPAPIGQPTTGSPFGELRQLATNKLKGNGAKIVIAICNGAGCAPLANLKMLLEWSDVENCWNSARQRLNKELKKEGWTFYTHDGMARAKQITVTGRK